MSDEDDVFDEFEEDVGEREGDPFDALDAPEDIEEDDGELDEPVWEADERTDESDASKADDDAAVETREEPSIAGPETDRIDPEASAPRSEKPAEQEQRTGDPFEAAEQAFEEMDVAELDADDVWESLSAAQARGSVTESDGRTYAEVSKHSYCEHCEFFSAPPEVSCAHDGTQILEFLDMETVRVVDCPVVDERRELERQQ